MKARLDSRQSSKYLLLFCLIWISFAAQAQHGENTRTSIDTLNIFQADIRIYPRNSKEIFYQVKVSCILNIHIGLGFDYYRFYEKHLFALNELEKAFALIAQRSRECPCHQK